MRQLEGIAAVEADHKRHEVVVEFDAGVVSVARIRTWLDDFGYESTIIE